MSKHPMSDKDKKDWDDLCAYVEREILQYDANQHMQKDAVLKLKGLQRGQTVANNKVKENGLYGFDVILNTYKVNSITILNAIRDKDFSSEGAKIAYCNAIVRNQLNDMYERMEQVKRMNKAIDGIDDSIPTYNGREYKKKEVKKTRKYEELW